MYCLPVAILNLRSCAWTKDILSNLYAMGSCLSHNSCTQQTISGTKFKVQLLVRHYKLTKVTLDMKIHIVSATVHCSREGY